MSTSRLQDDLLQGFYEEQKLIREQLEIFDPLAVSLRQPVAQRLLSKGALIFFEVVCYLFALAVVALIIFIDRIFPFHLLHVLRSRELFSNNLGRADIDSLYFAVAGLLVLIALLSFILARVLRRVRLKNDILNLAGKHIKTLVGQHLKRMAVLDSIEQRHFTELPPMQANPTSIPPQITPDEDPNWRMDI